MKKKVVAFLFFVFACIPLAGFGQINPGTFVLGGGFSYYNSNVHNSDDKTQGFSVSPSVGIFVANNLAVGLGIAIYSNKNIENSKETFKYSESLIGPFVRYYKFLGEKTALFGNVGLNFSKTKSRETDISIENKGIAAVFTPGISYFASSKIGLEVSLGSIGYNRNISEAANTVDQLSEGKSSGLSLNWGLSNVALGIKFYLGRR